MNVSGVEGLISDFRSASTGFDKFKSFSSLANPFGVGGSKSSVGATVLVDIATTTTEAIIEGGALVTAGFGGLQVAADTQSLSIVVGVSGSGGGGGELGFVAVVPITYVGRTTTAEVKDGALLRVDGDTAITAKDDLLHVVVAGGITSGSSTGIGVSIAVTVLERTTVAKLGTLAAGSSLGALLVMAENTGASYSLALVGAIVSPDTSGGGLANGDVDTSTSQDTNSGVSTGTSNINDSGGTATSGSNAVDGQQGKEQQDNALAAAGSVAITVGFDNVLASVSGLRSVSGVALAVMATSSATAVSAAGAAAVSIAGKGGKATGLALAVAVNVLQAKTEAFAYGGGSLLLEGDPADPRGPPTDPVGVLVEADRSGESITIAAGVAVAVGSGSTVAVAGSLGINRVVQSTQAFLGVAEGVSATPLAITGVDFVTVRADDSANIYAVGGAVAVAVGSSGVGAGASLAVNQITAQTDVDVRGTRIGTEADPLTAANVTVEAISSNRILSIAVSVGVGSSTSGVAFTVAINLIIDDPITNYVHRSRARMIDGEVRTSGDVTVEAIDEAGIFSIAGAVAVGGGGAGFGAAIGINVVFSDAQALIDGTLVRARDVTVRADAIEDDSETALDDKIIAATAAVGVSLSSAGVAVALSINVVTVDVDAGILDADIDVTGDVLVRATDQSTIRAVTAGVGGGSSAGVGVSASANVIVGEVGSDDPAVYARIDGGTVFADGSIEVSVGASAEHTSVTIAGGGGGTAGVAASIAVAVSDTTARAAVFGGAVVDAGDNVIVRATTSSEVNALAGSAAGGGTAGVGGSINVVVVLMTAEAIIENATVSADGTDDPVTFETSLGDVRSGVLVEATADPTLRVGAVGGAGGGTAAVAGAITVSVIDVTAEARIGQENVAALAATVDASGDDAVTDDGGDVVVLGRTAMVLLGLAGSGAGAGTAAIGVAGEVGVANVTARAIVGRDAVVDAAGDVVVQAFQQQRVVSLTIAGGGAGVAAIGVTAGVSVLTLTTTALVDVGAEVTAEDTVVVTAEDGLQAAVVNINIQGAGVAAVGVGGGVSVIGVDTTATVRGTVTGRGLGDGVVANTGGFGVTLGDEVVSRDQDEDPFSFTVADVSSNTISYDDADLDGAEPTDGEEVLYEPGTYEIGGLRRARNYFIVNADNTANTFQLAETPGGTPIAISSAFALAVDSDSDEVTIPDHTYVVGDTFVYDPADGLISGLVAGASYTVGSVDGDAITLLDADGDLVQLYQAVAPRLDEQHQLEWLSARAATPAPSGSDTFDVPDELDVLDVTESATPSTAVHRGVVVVAVSSVQAAIAGVAGGGAGAAAVPVSIGVAVHTIDTEARIATGATVTAGPDSNGTAGGKDVTVAAGRHHELIAIGISAAGAGAAAVAPALSLPLLFGDTLAVIGHAPDETVDASTLASATTVRARDGDVNVVATAQSRTIGIVLSVAVAGAAGVAPSVLVMSVDTTTVASIGRADVHARGSVVVTATDTNDLIAVAGAIGGGGGAGVGAGFAVTLVTKDVTATIDDHSEVDGDAAVGAGVLIPSGATAADADGFITDTVEMQGVVVSASTSEVLVAVAAAAGGGIVGVAGGISVELWDSDASAGILDGSKINKRNGAAASGQDVAVVAVGQLQVTSIAVSIAGGAVGVGASVDVGVYNNDVRAEIRDSQVEASDAVHVIALQRDNVTSAVVAGSGGGIGISGAISVLTLAGDFTSTYTPSEDPEDGCDESSGDTCSQNALESQGGTTDGQTVLGYLSDEIADRASDAGGGTVTTSGGSSRAALALDSGATGTNTATDRVGTEADIDAETRVGTTASATPGTEALVDGTTTIVANEVHVAARRDLTADGVAGGVALGGIAVGVGVVVVTTDVDVTATIAQGVILTASGTGSVVTVDAELASNVGVLGIAGAGGFFGALAGSVSVHTDSSTVMALLGATRSGDGLVEAATADAGLLVDGFGTVRVDARAARTVRLASGAAAISGSIGAGIAVAVTDLSGAVRSHVGTYAVIGRPSTEGAPIGSLAVDADHEVTVGPYVEGDPMGIALGGGFVGVAGGGAAVYVDSGSLDFVAATIGDHVTIVALGAVDVTASSTVGIDAEADGVSVGAFAIGIVIVIVEAGGDITASIGEDSSIAAGSVKIEAVDATAVTARMTSAGGGFISGRGGRADSEVIRTITAEVGSSTTIVTLADGDGPEAGDVTVRASAPRTEADSTAGSYGGGGADVAVVIAYATSSATLVASLGTDVVVLAEGDVLVEADAPNSATGTFGTDVTRNVSTADSFTLANHGLRTGDVVSFDRGQLSAANIDTVVASLGRCTTCSTGVFENYAVIVIDDNTFRLGRILDVTSADTSGLTSSEVGVDGDRDVIRFATAHGFVDGDPVRYLRSGGTTDLLSTGTTYYVHSVDADTIRLFTDRNDALDRGQTFRACTYDTSTGSNGAQYGTCDATTTGTITTSGAHGFQVGDVVTYTGATDFLVAGCATDLDPDNLTAGGGCAPAPNENTLGLSRDVDGDGNADTFVPGSTTIRVDHGLQTGDRVTVDVLAGTVTGLPDGTYYVIRVDESFVKLASSRCLATGECYTDVTSGSPPVTTRVFTPQTPVAFSASSDALIAILLADIAALSPTTRYRVASTPTTTSLTLETLAGTAVTFNGNDRPGLHGLTLAGVDLTASTDDGVHQLVIDIDDSAGVGPVTLYAANGTELRLKALPSGDGVTGVSTDGVGIGGLAINIASSSASSTVIAGASVSDGADVKAVGDVTVRSNGVAKSSIASDGIGGGLIGAADVRVDGYTLVDSTATVGDASISSLGSVLIEAVGGADGYAKADALGGGLGGGGGGYADLFQDIDVDAQILTGASVTAQRGVVVRSEIDDVEADSVGRGFGAGFIGVGVAHAYIYQDLVAVTSVGDADIEAAWVVLRSTLGSNIDTEADAYAEAYGAGAGVEVYSRLYGYASSNSRQTDASVIVADGHRIEGVAGIDLIADRADLGPTSRTTTDYDLGGLIPIPNVQTTNDKDDIDVTVDVGDGLVVVGARDDDLAALTGLVNRVAAEDPVALYVQSSAPGADGDDDDGAEPNGNVTFDADVIVLGGNSAAPLLIVDDQGKVVEARGVTINGGTSTPAAGTDVDPTDRGYYVVDAITAGDFANVVVVADGRITNGIATEPTIEWREALESVTIVDDSGLELRISGIDVVVPTAAQPDVFIRTDNDTGWRFRIQFGSAPSLVDVRKEVGLTHLAGAIVNPIGLTRLVVDTLTTAGSAATITTNIFQLHATGSIGTSTNRVHVDLIRSTALPHLEGPAAPFVRDSVIVVDTIDGDVWLSLRGIDRVAAGAGGVTSHTIDVDRIAVTGIGSIDIELRTTQHQTGTTGEVGVFVWVYANGTYQVINSGVRYTRFRPDLVGVSRARRDVALFAGTITPIDGVYRFQQRRSILALTITDAVVDALAPYDVVRSGEGEFEIFGSPLIADTAGVAVGNGDVTIQDTEGLGDLNDRSADVIHRTGSPSAEELTVIAVEGFVDLDDLRSPLLVNVDGYVDLEEVTDDLAVGMVRSRLDDVTLTSPERIVDAVSDPQTTPDPVTSTYPSAVPYPGTDVRAVNITLIAGHSNAQGGIGETDDYLEIDVDANVAFRAPGTAPGVLNAFDDTATTTLGIYLTETSSDLHLDSVYTTDGQGDVSLQTLDGSILDSRDEGDGDGAENVRGEIVDLDANGPGSTVGAADGSNDLEIDSSRSHDDGTGTPADVGIESTDGIWLTEVDGTLYLTLAHALDGDIRITVREEKAEYDEDLELLRDGVVRFAETGTRTIANGQIFAEGGNVLLLVGDDVSLDTNSEVLAEQDVDIYADAAAAALDPTTDLDPGHGATVLLNGRLIAGCVVTPGTPAGACEPTLSSPEYDFRVWGHTDVDLFRLGSDDGLPTPADRLENHGDDGYVFIGSRTTIRGGPDTDSTNGDDGEDRFEVYYLQDAAVTTGPATAALAAAGHALTLDGQAETDRYEVWTTGSRSASPRNYVINLLDTGAPDDGVDEATIHGVDSASTADLSDDLFLLRAVTCIDTEGPFEDLDADGNCGTPTAADADRPGFVALLHGDIDDFRYNGTTDVDDPDPAVQRINYDTGLNGRLTVLGHGGNDGFFMDDLTVITTIDGGAGDDVFQIGQIFGSKRTADELGDPATAPFASGGALLPQDTFPELIASTRGWLSPGANAPLVVHGGTGEDQFTVYANKAEVRLEGDDQNDLFVVRAFAVAATCDTSADHIAGCQLADVTLAADEATGEFPEVDGTIDIGGQTIGICGDPNGAHRRDNDGNGVCNNLDANVTDTWLDDVIPLDENEVAVPVIGGGFSTGKALDIRTGGGDDEVKYNVNAPVSVDGGTGIDKLAVLGTEFADDIVISDDNIYGAGLNVRYDAVEIVEIDGLEGDDEFFVLSTSFGVAYRVIGGLGSDTINVAGDVVEDIVTLELEGLSGAVDHIVSSDGDAEYDGVATDGIETNVATSEVGVVLIEETDGFTSVRENGRVENNVAGAFQNIDGYKIWIREGSNPDDTEVYITVSAARSPQEEADDELDNDLPLTNGEGDTLWICTTATEGVGCDTQADFQRAIMIGGSLVYENRRAVVLTFTTDGADAAQWIYVWAVDEAADELGDVSEIDDRSEGDRVVAVSHTVISENQILDGAVVRNVEVAVRDNDTPGVYIVEVEPAGPAGHGTHVEDQRSVVMESTDWSDVAEYTGVDDEILVTLAKELAAGTTVVLDVVISDSAAITLVNLLADSRFDPDAMTITFTGPDWKDPVHIGIRARVDGVEEEDQVAVISFTCRSTTDPGYQAADGTCAVPNLRSEPGQVDVEVIDDDTAGVFITESGGDTIVELDGATDDYTIRLTKRPGDDVTIAVLTDGTTDVTMITLPDGTVVPVTYDVIGVYRDALLFDGAVDISTTGGVTTLTRGNGSDLESFHLEGFAVGQLVQISVPDPSDPLVRVTIEAYITALTATAMTLDLDLTGGATPVVDGDDYQDVFISRRIREGVYNGSLTVEIGAGGERRIVLPGVTGDDPGWLSSGFLEGQWVRVCDSTGDCRDLKIGLIRGDNDAKDTKLEFTTTGGFPWVAGDEIVSVQRIGVVVPFTDDDWYLERTITLGADSAYDVPSTRSGVKVFPGRRHVLSRIRGPLSVEGGPSGADRSLVNGIKLPGEVDTALPAIGAQPPESQMIDVLNIFDDARKGAGVGTMTSAGLIGFDMADELVFNAADVSTFGEQVTFPGGITWSQISVVDGQFETDGGQSSIEVVNLLLGYQNDVLDIQGTLDPAPPVQSTNTFTFTPDGSGGGTITYTPTWDWKWQGYLVGQTVTFEGVDGTWLVDGIVDGPNGERNHTIVLVPKVAGVAAPFPDGDVKVRIIAEDDDVIVTAVVEVERTLSEDPDGEPVVDIIEITGSVDWMAEGFIEGHLVKIYDLEGATWRLLEIVDNGDGTQTMRLRGDGLYALVDGEPAYVQPESGELTIFVQGRHGGLTVVHGGGNRPIAVTSEFIVENGNELVRTDGRSWSENGFAIGQFIQIDGVAGTREITDITDWTCPAPPPGETTFDGCGTGSVLVLAENVTVGTGPIEIHAAQPFVDEIVAEVEIHTDHLVLTDPVRAPGDSWAALGFSVGQIVNISACSNPTAPEAAACEGTTGLPGGFTVSAIDGDKLFLGNVALTPTILDPAGPTYFTVRLRIWGLDTALDGGALMGGDTLTVCNPDNPIACGPVVAGPNSPLVLLGDTTQDGMWYSGLSYNVFGLEFGDKPYDPFVHLPDGDNEDDEWVFPLADPFDDFGNDVIDARNLLGENPDGTLWTIGITAYGGPGNDTIWGSQTGDHLAGGSGDDTIVGLRGADHIYGDSGINVNILDRALYIPTTNASPLSTIDLSRVRFVNNGTTIEPAASAVFDDLVAGRDVLTGNGPGSFGHLDPLSFIDIVFGDHGVVEQDVIDPNLPDSRLQKIQTTTVGSLLSICSAEPANGADDVLFGSQHPDVLIGGGGNDMIDGLAGNDLLIGDNACIVRADYTSERFQTLIGGLLYSRTDQASDLAGPGVTVPSADDSGVLLVDGVAREYRSPVGAPWWAEFDIDMLGLHTFDVEDGVVAKGTFGNDYIAGGADHDMIFGQLGNDVIQGDGNIGDAFAAAGHVGASRSPDGCAANGDGTDAATAAGTCDLVGDR